MILPKALVLSAMMGFLGRGFKVWPGGVFGMTPYLEGSKKNSSVHRLVEPIPWKR